MNDTQTPPDGQSAASPLHPSKSNELDDFQEDALLEDEAAGWSAQFVVPFQQSGPIPTLNPQTARTSTNQTGTPVPGRTTSRRFPILKVALISTLIVVAVGFLAFSVFAQPASHLTTVTKNSTQKIRVKHTTPTARPTRTMQMTPTPTMATTTPQATAQRDWFPSAQTLQQIGWAGAGLSTGDALEAEQTAWTFTTREMSLDFRNARLPPQHTGP